MTVSSGELWVLEQDSEIESKNTSAGVFLLLYGKWCKPICEFLVMGVKRDTGLFFFWLRQTAVIILSHSYLTAAEQLFCLHLASLLIQCPGRLLPTRSERAAWMRGAFKNKVYFLVINPFLISDFFLESSPAKSVADAASTDTASICLIHWSVFALEEQLRKCLIELQPFPSPSYMQELPESEG